MENIWSENKYVNLLINILLFLTGINFLHYGQLILPIICFILFVDNKLKFKVNNPKTFIILCLFAISFYAFSYKMGFYSVMGFTCPMAYYIGSNMKNPTEDNIKKIIYLFAISMGLHVILNCVYEYFVHGKHGFFMSTTHYDFWTKEKIANTATAVNADIMLGCLYYLVFHEKNRKIKILNLIILAASMFYLVVIGRRTPVMMILIVFVSSFIYETKYLKNNSKKLKNSFLTISICALIFLALLIITYSFNLFNARTVLQEYHIILKFTRSFINDQRFELYFGSFPLMPKYPFGGQHISTILGEQIHDFWIDIYDYAGIVPCFVMIVYSIIYLKNMIRFLKTESISADFRILSLGVFICIALQMFFEPIMTGSSLFLIVSIIIGALFERLIISEE